MELTIQQYADSKGLTYQAISKKIKNSKELQKLVVKRERTRYLTDEAQRILDNSIRDKKVVTLGNEHYEKKLNEKDAELQQLKADYEKDLEEKDRLIKELQEKYNKDKEEHLNIIQAFLNKEQYYLNEKQQLLESKEKQDTQLLLAVTSRKERRRIKKELKAKIDK